MIATAAAPFDFAPLTATAPDAARPALDASARKFGFVPDPVARAARAPVALRQLLAALAAFEQTSLAPIEREVVAMTVAWENECHYCMALHTALLAATPEHAPAVAALRAGTPIPDARLETLRRFTRSVVRDRGRVPEALQGALRDAGFDESHVLEIVLGVGAYQLSTLVNIVTGAVPDAPFAPFGWRHPAALADAPAAGA